MLAVTVVFSPAARDVFDEVLHIAEGSTIRDAVAASALAVRFPGQCWETMEVGIWGRAAAWDRALEEGDRIEFCRPLQVDPKVARRDRFRKQGARGTGLFAARRKGGKAGY